MGETFKSSVDFAVAALAGLPFFGFAGWLSSSSAAVVSLSPLAMARTLSRPGKMLLLPWRLLFRYIAPPTTRRRITMAERFQPIQFAGCDWIGDVSDSAVSNSISGGGGGVEEI